MKDMGANTLKLMLEESATKLERLGAKNVSGKSSKLVSGREGALLSKGVG